MKLEPVSVYLKQDILFLLYGMLAYDYPSPPKIYILYKLQNWKEDFAAFMAVCVLSLLFLDLEGRCLIFNII